MIVALIADQRKYTTTLPEKVSGRYWITDHADDGSIRELADIEGIEGNWVIHNSVQFGLLDEKNQEVQSLTLNSGVQVFNAFYRSNKVAVRLLIEPSTTDRKTYHKYYVGKNCRLNIGRTSDNQISYDNQYVSAQHACLIFENGLWTVTDTQSTNGTFVNECRVVNTKLMPGNVVYIMGLKIIVGESFFAVNNPDGKVAVNAAGVNKLIPQRTLASTDDFIFDPEFERFYRSPRLCRRISKGVIRVDAPPQAQKFEETPLALLLGPALTMGMTATVMAAVSLYNYNLGNANLTSTIPTLVMAFSMLCGTLLWPFLTRKHEKKKKAEIENKRHTKYREYLADIKNRIFAISEEQKAILLENSPDNQECKSRVLSHDRKLWERTVGQDDFLHLRLGLGDVPIDAEIKFPEKRFTVDDDALQNEVQRLADEPKVLKDAPVLCDLNKNPVVGIVGSPEKTTAFLQGLVLQIVSLHSYDEVKLGFIVGGGDLAQWDYTRFLPHTQDNSGSQRFFATSIEEAKLVVSTIEQVLIDRNSDQGQQPSYSPNYVIIAPDIALAECAGVFAQLFSSRAALGVSCITTARDLISLPKECSLVIDLNGAQASIYDRNDPAGDSVVFTAEDAQNIDMAQITNVLSNLAMDTENTSYSLPSMITFLEMYGVGKVEHLNALTRWRENSPINTLQAPIGVSPDGSLLFLDLHEKAHGPHGLVAGMTGSGKSEFIITFILSMAVNYHPNEVSFILIDYKGGGLAGAFEDTGAGIRLPHLAGTITNLDGAAVNRALISIQSELRRRQAIFNNARQVSGEGTIDIYKYQKMYRSGLVSEPVPHLFIVSDEFAELKAQQPEFMAQLISAARIGRSLGVHLILATQKPSGVVDDQIWSNSRFRVCLKVQERADSIEMLKRPDAAELKETGRFYLQVGFNELFELGQSAWCGAPYVPADRVEKKRDDSVEVIDHLGRTILTAQPKATGMRNSNTSQIVSIVRYLSDLEHDAKAVARRLWLPQIDAMIYLEDLKKKYAWTANRYEINPVIGEYDDPYNQAQGLVTIPFTREGNAIIYGMTGSGKTTLLNTVLTGLISDYSADALNIYIIDLGEETLRAFADAPQVGDVLFSGDDEKIETLFKMLQAELNSRKKLISEADGDYVSYCAHSDNPLPQILIVMRNYSAFYEQFDGIDERFIQISRECSKYGMYFLLTANSGSAVRYRVAQNFASTFALQLNDATDYSGLFGSTNGVYPSKIKGRGLIKRNQVYEFQTAHWQKDFDQKAIRKLANELKAHAKFFTKPVPVLPDHLTSEYFTEKFTADAIPVGIEKSSFQTSFLNLNQSVITLIMAQDQDELSATTQGICEQVAKLGANMTIFDAAGLLETSISGSCEYVRKGFEKQVKILFAETKRRNHSYKNAISTNGPLEKFEPEYYVITGYQSIVSELSEEGADYFKVALKKAELPYNLRFILCGTASEINDMTYNEWYKTQISGTDGIWAGNGFGGQYLLKANRTGGNPTSEIPQRFGYNLKRGKLSLVKLIVGKNCKEEE